MAETTVNYKSGYGVEAALPQTVTEGQLLFSTDTKKVTLDADGTRKRYNPPGDWNETNSTSPAFIENKPDVESILEDLARLRAIQGKMYGVVWDKTSSSMRRIFDAEGITTDTTNFVHLGNINSSYNNPFDLIYPWSDCKQCNVDLDLYRALVPGQDIRDCVTAWFGDPDFATDGSNGFVGRYTPEFWYYGFEDTRGKIIVVSDREVDGFIRHRASIRSHGFAVDDGNNGVTSNDGYPMCNVAVSTIHSKATSGGFTLLDVYEYDADVALFMVEFASTDAQSKLGDGCSNYFSNPNFKVTAAATGATTVLAPVSLQSLCFVGGGIVFSSSADSGGHGDYRTITSIESYDSTYCRINFTPSINLTTDMYINVLGKNNSDSIGNKSGYIGINGKNNAWYRGVILYGNRYQYLLGAARQTGTGHLWLCPASECDSYDGLDTSAFYDTGIVILSPNSNSWQNVGDYSVAEGKLAAWGPIKTAASVVGDQQYCVPLATGNTAPFVGCAASNGAYCGVLGGRWIYAPSHSWWFSAACLLLRSP